MAGEMKIAVIGAGSPLFTPDLLQSLLSKRGLYGSRLCLHDIDAGRLDFMTGYAHAFLGANGGGYDVSAMADRDEALQGADFVISLVSVGSLEMRILDAEVPARHGVVHVKGDTTGPAGIFRGLRTIPFVTGLAKSMEKLCPKAVLLNLTNPMTVVTRAASMCSAIKTIGICTAVGGMRRDIAGKLGLEEGRLALCSCGVNHFTWMSSLTCDGRDAIAEFERRALPDYLSLPVTGDLYETFGCFPIPGYKYASEFFRRYLGPETDYGRKLGFSPCSPKARSEEAARSYDRLARRIAERDFLPDARNLDTDTIADVVESIWLNRPATIHLNTPNLGQLPFLPPGAVVEGPVALAGENLLPLCCPGLPEAVQEELRRVTSEQELAVRAGVEGDRQALLDALLADPLVPSASAARGIAEELLDAEREFLPQFHN